MNITVTNVWFQIYGSLESSGWLLPVQIAILIIFLFPIIKYLWDKHGAGWYNRRIRGR